jgi:hypothetical protein
MRYATRLFAALPLAVLPSVVHDVSLAPPRVDGYVITMSITSEGAGMNAPINMTLKAAGTKLRMEMDFSAMMSAASGGVDGAMMSGLYVLPQDDGRMAMILPNMQNPFGSGMGMGMIMDPQAMVGAVRDRGLSVPTFSDMKISVADLGVGESIVGRSTRKYKMTQSYLIDGKQHEGVSEIWIATDMADAEVALRKFGAFGNQFVGAATSKHVQAEMDAKMPKGFALRTLVTMTTPDGAQTVKMETVKAEKATFDDKEFEVPAGIQLMDMAAMMKRGN